jgi:hypothetical protein
MKVRKRWLAAVASLVVAVGAGLAAAAIPGASSAPGPVGAGYRIEGEGIEVTAGAPDPPQQILSLRLPPGSYAISAEFNVDKPTGDGILACAVPTGGLYSAPIGGWIALGTGPGDQRSDQFSGTGLDVLPNGGTARLVCRQWNGATGDNPVIEQVALSAVRIGSVNSQ